MGLEENESEQTSGEGRGPYHKGLITTLRSSDFLLDTVEKALGEISSRRIDTTFLSCAHICLCISH
jgi:hypothetical protein